MGAFANIVQVMEGLNMFHLFFPWLLVLAVTYGLLQKYEIFGDETVNGIIALAVAFLSIGGFATFVPPNLFTHFAAAIGFGIFGLLGLIVLMSLAGIDISELEKFDLPGIGALVIVLVSFIGVLGTQLDIEAILGGLAGGNVWNEVVMPVLVLVFLIIVISSVGGSEG